MSLREQLCCEQRKRKDEDLVKMLSTTPQTIFSEVDGSVAIQMLEESDKSIVQAHTFRSVDVDRYRCVHCSRKLTPGLETKVVKCMRCFRRMRLRDCRLNVSCRVTVTVDDDEKELSMFEEVLSKLLNTENVCELSEDVIAAKLLDLQDIEITFKEDVISACKL